MNLFVTKNLWINHYLCLSLVGRPGKILFCRIEKVDRILKMNILVEIQIYLNIYKVGWGPPSVITFSKRSIEKVDRILKMNIGWNEKKYDAFTEPWSVQQKWSLDLESRSCSLASRSSCSVTPVCICLILHICNIFTFLIFAFTKSSYF